MSAGVAPDASDLAALLPFAETDAQRRAIESVIEHGSCRAAERATGVHNTAIGKAIQRARRKAAHADDTKPFEIAPLPEDDVPIEELIEHRKRQFARKREHEQARKLIPVEVKIDGPIAIWHAGDPHVDDDGTDLDAIERHTEIVRTTEGFFAANVGDTTNNWVGRLARLYAEQSTSASQSWRIAEWFMRRCDWLYVVGGNHDCWSGAGDPLHWMTRQAGALYESSEARLELRFPNGRKVRINARHDFKGHSQWNPAHGSMKAAQFGTHDHILVNGHKHVSGYGVIKDPNTGVISHCIQVASYKVFDRYARERGFRDQHISPCAVTIIDPEASDVSLVRLEWEPEPAAEYLTYLRKKRKAA